MSIFGLAENFVYGSDLFIIGQACDTDIRFWLIAPWKQHIDSLVTPYWISFQYDPGLAYVVSKLPEIFISEY